MTIDQEFIGSLPRLPKLIVFDLDYTIWPQWIDYTYGPPYTYIESKNALINSYKERLELYPDFTAIVALIHSFPDTKMAVASRTSTPDWAKLALETFVVPEMDNMPLYDAFSYLEIFPARKLEHFAAISEASGIDCKDMLFFDDESRNREVTRLGVHFVLLSQRDGITWSTFKKGLKEFAKKS
ncbi:magnesium-dependent phosphatase-1 [Phycomyces blakesleeanus]